MVVGTRLWKAKFQRKNRRDQAHTGSQRIGQEGALLSVYVRVRDAVSS